MVFSRLRMRQRLLTQTSRVALNTSRRFSVDTSELKKFASVGSDWWSPSSASGTGPLHSMNPTRVRFIQEAVAKSRGTSDLPPWKQLRGLSILDVGCGGGLLSEALARLGAKVTAIDPAPENIMVARGHSSHDPVTASIDYRTSTIEEVSRSGEKFDVVCSLEVLEHVKSPAQFVRDCASCLTADNGDMFVSTINRTAKSYIIAIAGAEYIAKMVPRGTHEWSKFITPSELAGYATEAGMVIEDKRGLLIDELPPVLAVKIACGGEMNWSLSASDLDVNYIVHIKRGK